MKIATWLKGLRRGFNQTYAFVDIAGTNDRGRVVKTFDSHAHDGLQVVGQMCGTASAKRRSDDIDRRRRERREENRDAKRFNPHRRRA
jgi:hypothetical protein